MLAEVAESIGRDLLAYGRRLPKAELFARIDAVDASAIRGVADRFVYDQVRRARGRQRALAVRWIAWPGGGVLSVWVPSPRDQRHGERHRRLHPPRDGSAPCAAPLPPSTRTLCPLTAQDMVVAAAGDVQFLPDYNFFRRRSYWLRY